MNFGALTGFTTKHLGAGQSYPVLKMKYITAATYSVEAGDQDTILYFDNSGTVTVTIGDTTALMGAGMFGVPQFHVAQWGAGQVQCVAGGAVTLVSAASENTRAQYSVISFVRPTYGDQTPIWHCFGDMEPAA